MVNWQVTATTIYCDVVDDEVTIMVYKDGVAECIAYKKYHMPNRETSKLLAKKSKQLGRKLECESSECYMVIQYRDKLFSEEAKKKSWPTNKEKVGPHEVERD